MSPNYCLLHLLSLGHSLATVTGRESLSLMLLSCLHSLTSIDVYLSRTHMTLCAAQSEGGLKAMLQALPVMAKFRVAIGAMSTKATVLAVVDVGAPMMQDIVTGEWSQTKCN